MIQSGLPTLKSTIFYQQLLYTKNELLPHTTSHWGMAVTDILTVAPFCTVIWKDTRLMSCQFAFYVWILFISKGVDLYNALYFGDA